MDRKFEKAPVLIIGNGKLLYSVTVCLLLAEHSVTLVTDNIEKEKTAKVINDHFFEFSKQVARSPQIGSLKIVEETGDIGEYEIGIAVIEENEAAKIAAVQMLEKHVTANAVILITTESIPLNLLQEAATHPERIIGANWSEPAHTTKFLELITNEKTDNKLLGAIYDLAKIGWGKDPYILPHNVGIRGKLFSAMIREAFYLVQNDYASIEDIDRACRNDAGYYLPFSGNFRYMDLMGTYAYGLVMKDLNPDLSKGVVVPGFVKKMVEQGAHGMENNKGFYKYEQEEVDRWDETFRKFSYQIQKIINKYPFDRSNETSAGDQKPITITNEPKVNF